MNAEYRKQLHRLIGEFQAKGVFPGYLDQLIALVEIIHTSAYCEGVKAGQTLVGLPHDAD